MGPGAGEASPAPGVAFRIAPVALTFGDRLAAAVERRQSQVVLGLDPHPERVWPRTHATDAAVREAAVELAAALGLEPAPGDPAPGLSAAAEVLHHCRRVIDAAGDACVAIKPQLACFERLGGAGWLVLHSVCAYARARELIVLADGKRGDVPVTAAAYADALITGTVAGTTHLPGLSADAVTANPLLGRDALEPLIDGARSASAGVFVLVRTSNPGAADLMDELLADGAPLWERIARLVADLGSGHRGPGSGLADVGAVTGATEPRHLARMRELMPHTPFLLPGIGAQGGDVAALGAAFAAGRASALVTAARSIVDAHAQTGGEPAQAARRAAEGLREQAWALG